MTEAATIVEFASGAVACLRDQQGKGTAALIGKKGRESMCTGPIIPCPAITSFSVCLARLSQPHARTSPVFADELDAGGCGSRFQLAQDHRWRIIRNNGEGDVTKPVSDIDRYRALLKEADDEPKRLALIQLVIAERARDRLAANSRAAETDPALEQSLPFKRPSEPQPPSFGELSTEPEAQNAGRIDGSQAERSVPVASSEPASAGDDLVESSAKILSSRQSMAEASPAGASTSSAGVPLSGNDIESLIAALIRSAQEKRDRP
jgi:hypothetical protein